MEREIEDTLVGALFLASFLLLWLLFAAFFVVLLVGLFRRRHDLARYKDWHVFSAAKSTEEMHRNNRMRNQIIFEEIGRHFFSIVGRFHAGGLLLLAVTTVVLGIWAAIELESAR